jgi:DNA modification methylase
MLALINADARSILLADQSVQCVVTSPPYWGLRDYGVAGQIGLERTPEEYVAILVGVFREVRRVLKPDGTLWLNLGDSYASGEVGRHDQKGGSLGIGKGFGVPRQYAKLESGLKPKDLVGIPWRVAFALQADGWWLRSDIIWHKPNPMPESVTDRPTKAHEYLFLLTKAERYYYDVDAIREPNAREWDESNGGSIRTGRMVAAGGAMGDMSSRPKGYPLPHPLGANRRTVWTVATTPYSGAHFATFPEKLVEPCILAGSKPGDLVFDPFCGTATVGRVAVNHNRAFVGLELNTKYLPLASRRTSEVQRRLMETA